MSEPRVNPSKTTGLQTDAKPPATPGVEVELRTDSPTGSGGIEQGGGIGTQVSPGGNPRDYKQPGSVLKEEIVGRLESLWCLSKKHSFCGGGAMRFSRTLGRRVQQLCRCECHEEQT